MKNAARAVLFSAGNKTCAPSVNEVDRKIHYTSKHRLWIAQRHIPGESPLEPFMKKGDSYMEAVWFIGGTMAGMAMGVCLMCLLQINREEEREED